MPTVRVGLANPKPGQNAQNQADGQSLLPHERDQTTRREGTSRGNEDERSRAIRVVAMMVNVPEVASSPALSLFARPGDGSIAARRIAILVADGVDGASARALQAGLAAKGAVPRFVGVRLGTVQSTDSNEIEVDVTFETMPAAVYRGHRCAPPLRARNGSANRSGVGVEPACLHPAPLRQLIRFN